MISAIELSSDAMRCQIVKRARSHISFKADARWEMGADALGVRVLQPGESMSAEISIQVERSP